jgi:hypothetical protein
MPLVCAAVTVGTAVDLQESELTCSTTLQVGRR